MSLRLCSRSRNLASDQRILKNSNLAKIRQKVSGPPPALVARMWRSLRMYCYVSYAQLFIHWSEHFHLQRVSLPIE